MLKAEKKSEEKGTSKHTASSTQNVSTNDKREGKGGEKKKQKQYYDIKNNMCMIFLDYVLTKKKINHTFTKQND
jgi:hypothetical protein